MTVAVSFFMIALLRETRHPFPLLSFRLLFLFSSSSSSTEKRARDCKTSFLLSFATSGHAPPLATSDTAAVRADSGLLTLKLYRGQDKKEKERESDRETGREVDGQIPSIFIFLAITCERP